MRFSMRRGETGKADRNGTAVYIECQADGLVEAQQGADEVLQDLVKEWFKPEVYGLAMA